MYEKKMTNGRKDFRASFAEISYKYGTRVIGNIHN